MNNTAILAPVVVLVLWTMVMALWLYATRIPAMKRMRVKLDPTVPPRSLTDTLPPQVRWKADNYNHLLEQPTAFYAIVLTLAIAGVGDTVNLVLAWAYVVLRIIHSLVQATVNVIMIRFSIFSLASLVLIALGIHAACAVF